MSDFRRLSDQFSASPQIDTGGVADAAARGFTTIVNNRPDGEVAGQPTGAAIEAEASAAGLSYHAIPVDHTGFTDAHIAAMAKVLDEADGKVLAYCRSGTRSTLLWALARASKGDDPDQLAQAAKDAGYDLGPVRTAMKALAGDRKG